MASKDSKTKSAAGIIGTLQQYVSKMISIPGMKAFLMDEETVCVYNNTYNDLLI